MNLLFLILAVIITILLLLFYLISAKFNSENSMMASFECGFSSYFNSRFSFCIHYFLIGLIFLFLDLELSIAIPLMSESISNLILLTNLIYLILILLVSIFLEWWDGKLNWHF